MVYTRRLRFGSIVMDTLVLLELVLTRGHGVMIGVCIVCLRWCGMCVQCEVE